MNRFVSDESMTAAAGWITRLTVMMISLYRKTKRHKFFKSTFDIFVSVALFPCFPHYCKSEHMYMA